MPHPYNDLPSSGYWRTGVADVGPHQLSELWTPKFAIRPKDVVVTAGSCFAQHIGKALSDEGYAWTDFEPAPPFLSDQDARDHGYGVFSFRTGNIYTVSMLLQWLRLAFDQMDPPEEVWVKDGRYYDPMRPAIEPNGFADPGELQAARDATCQSLRRAIRNADVFIFTLGLTEHWTNSQSGLEYALCPGTLAGTFDAEQHQFVNANAGTVTRDLTRLIRFLRTENRNLRLLLTVSPVPLTATASGQHVLTATSYSKSVLRAAAGMAAQDFKRVDYFPSYEIITHPIFRGMFYAPNMRSVDPAGVRTVMHHFFSDQHRVFGPVSRPAPRNAALPSDRKAADIRCEEVMLDAFAR